MWFSLSGFGEGHKNTKLFLEGHKSIDKAIRRKHKDTGDL
jgi:hypothetical protein